MLNNIAEKHHLTMIMLVMLALGFTSTGYGDDAAHVAEIRRRYGGKEQMVIGLALRYERFTEVLPYLSQISELRYLTCGTKQLTAEDVKIIGTLTQLERLLINATKLTSQDLEPLGNLHNLQRLQIYDAPNVNDEIFRTIAKLKVKDLDLHNTSIDGSQIELLERNENLSILYLGGTQLNDQNAIKLLKFPQLQRLRVEETKITDHGIHNLIGMPRLTEFYAGEFPKAKQIEFAKIALEHRQNARAAGDITAPDNLAPYAKALEE